MKKIKFYVWIIFFLILLLPYDALASNKAEELQKKIQEISALQVKLEAKKKQSKVIRIKFNAIIKALKKEIINKQQRLGITSYQQANRSPRINYNLRIIQRLMIYNDKLSEMIVKMQVGNAELEFLNQQASDDLKIVKVLADKKIEKLVVQINHIVGKYLPDADKFVINIDDIAVPKFEDIWNQIMREKEKK